MGTLYIDTGGAATNSGSSDSNTPDLTVTVDASYGGGTTIPLSGSPDLSGISTSGDTQAAVYFGDATNSNLKVFWITAVDNTAKTITVHTAPTGLTAGSSQGNIGGRQTVVQTCVDALRGGDTLIINNSPAARSGSQIVSRANGNPIDGYITVKGKRGASRPVLVSTGSNQHAIVVNNNMWWFEYLEIQAQGSSSAAVVNNLGNANVYFDIKVTDAGSNGIAIGGVSQYNWVIACEVSGAELDGISASGLGVVLLGNYIHDNGRYGINFAGGVNSAGFIAENVLDSNAQGNAVLGSIAANANQGTIFYRNTVYGAPSHGVSVGYTIRTLFLNNLLSENGDEAGKYNLNVTSGGLNVTSVDWEKSSLHGWNIFHKASGDNVTGITLNSQVAASELTSDPLLTDPANGDFTPGSGSPALEAGFPPGFPYA